MKRLLLLIVAILLVGSPAFSQKKDVYKVRTVVIDPGHGGAKPGAHGAKSQEKEITLAIAKKFGQLIKDNYPDVKVIYTRTTDVDISLAERAHIANSNKADLFVSIHANSHPTSAPTGVETFVMGLSESRANLEVAKKENADILLEADYKTNSAYSGFDPNSPESYVMLTMFQHAYLDKSLNFAQAVQSQYKKNLRTINRGVKQAELYVLYKTSMPSVLTEVGFISNPTEENFMLSDEGQAKIAICLFNAFMSYKASEEGTQVIANPVINIKGYSAKPAVDKQPAPDAKPQTQPEVKIELPVEIAQAQPVDPIAQPIESAAEPSASVQPVEPARPQISPATAHVLPIIEPEVMTVDSLTPMPDPLAPIDKPLPSVGLVQKESAPEPIEVVVDPPATSPVAQPTVQPVAPEPEPQQGLASPVNTATSAERYYTVQFLTSTQLYLAGDAELDGISNFETYRKGDAYCYTTGRFATFKEAQNYTAEVQRTTRFKDAWTLQRKVAPEPVAATPAPASADRVSFRVQICTTPRPLKPTDSELRGISDYHESAVGNGYLYTVGDYATQREAQTRCNQLRQGRFKDAFVIAIYRDQRITLEEARRIANSTK